jgi:CubicO group peptidase (beta-lactamase class C family)
LAAVKSSVLVLLLALLAWPCAAETQGGLESESLAALLEEVRAKHDVPALGAAIVTEDGPVLIEVVGVRKRGDRTKAQKNDMFHLGSCTKAFTGWLAGWAVENGKLRWDSTLGEIFPRESRKWSEAQKGITLKQLLTHRSGIEGDLPGGNDRWRHQSSPKVDGRETKRQRLEMVEALSDHSLASEPGSTYTYCNTNQILAAAMVEQVTRKPWETLIEELIFRPLAMREVGQGPMGQRGRIEQPWQHTVSGEGVDPVPQNDAPEVMGPSGRLHMSLDSWGQFAAEILRAARGQGTLLKKQTYQELLGGDSYTKGCWRSGGNNEHGQALVLSHSGSNRMNRALASIHPPGNFAILVATNQGGTEPDTPGSKVCQELVERLIDMCRQQEIAASLQ